MSTPQAVQSPSSEFQDGRDDPKDDILDGSDANALLRLSPGGSGRKGRDESLAEIPPGARERIAQLLMDRRKDQHQIRQLKEELQLALTGDQDARSDQAEALRQSSIQAVRRDVDRLNQLISQAAAIYAAGFIFDADEIGTPTLERTRLIDSIIGKDLRGLITHEASFKWVQAAFAAAALQVFLVNSVAPRIACWVIDDAVASERLEQVFTQVRAAEEPESCSRWKAITLRSYSALQTNTDPDAQYKLITSHLKTFLEFSGWVPSIALQTQSFKSSVRAIIQVANELRSTLSTLWNGPDVEIDLACAGRFLCTQHLTGSVEETSITHPKGLAWAHVSPSPPGPDGKKAPPVRVLGTTQLGLKLHTRQGYQQILEPAVLYATDSAPNRRGSLDNRHTPTFLRRLSILNDVAPADPQARALYDYKGADDDPLELSFKQGDIFTITSSANNWWQAVDKTGRKGIVPSNFMKMLP